MIPAIYCVMVQWLTKKTDLAGHSGVHLLSQQLRKLKQKGHMGPEVEASLGNIVKTPSHKN
jgi:hypothetical protein